MANEPPKPSFGPELILDPAWSGLEYRLRAPAEVMKLVEGRIHAGFLRLFTAIDRLRTFQFFKELLTREGTPADPSGHRRLVVVFFYLAATMYEVGKALYFLEQHGVVAAMADPKVWDPLAAIRTEWYEPPLPKTDGPLPRKVRNQVGAHLGLLETYREGMAKMADRTSWPIYQTNESTRHEGYYNAAWDALILGLEIPNADWQTFIRSTWPTPETVPDLVMAAFKEVLRKAGIELRGMPEQGP